LEDEEMGRKAIIVMLICKMCGKEFPKTAAQIRASAKRGHEFKYCNKECYKADLGHPMRKRPFLEKD